LIGELVSTTDRICFPTDCEPVNMARKPSKRAATTSTRRRRLASATEPGDSSTTDLSLRTAAGGHFNLKFKVDPLKPSLAQEAMRWSYALRSRRRWSDSEAEIAEQGRQAAKFLDRFGVGDDTLRTIAKAGEVEVDIPWMGEEATGWEFRILPWEYLIAGATRVFRSDKKVTVTRHLCMKGDPAPPLPKSPSVLFVASEPGPLQGIFDYDTERDLVQSQMGVGSSNWHTLYNPTAEQLRAKVEEVRPAVVHLAGFDTHFARFNLFQRRDTQGIAELDNELGEGHLSPGELSDGYVLAGSLKAVGGQELGKILCADGRHRPHFVGLNIGSSAARIAPLVVQAGAGSATGFQDNFDDDLAELFFSVLYSRLRHRLGLKEAFSKAWETVRARPASAEGTGNGATRVSFSLRTPPLRS
jgi:hypothetical protein